MNPIRDGNDLDDDNKMSVLLGNKYTYSCNFIHAVFMSQCTIC